MKKLFLAVALIAATTVSVNAKKYATLDVSVSDLGLTASKTLTGAKDTTLSNGVEVVVAASKTVTLDLSSGTWVIAAGDTAYFANRFNMSSSGTANSLTIPITSGTSSLYVYFSSSSTGRILDYDLLDASGTALVSAQSLGTVTTAKIAVQGTVSLASYPKATKIRLYSSASGIYIYGLSYDKATVITGIKDAISSDLLKKAGDALVNPTALSVEVYSVTGVKVLNSAKTSINVSELPAGVYVAKTAKGTLKFIK